MTEIPTPEEIRMLLAWLGTLVAGGGFGFCFGMLYQQGREVARMNARHRGEAP